MDRTDLIERIRAGEAPKYLMFWGHTARPGQQAPGKECLSQWYPAPFSVDGCRVPTAEHFMMAEKARLFGDEVLRSAIRRCEHPGEAKRLGGEVRDFDDDLWEEHRSRIVVQGNIAKFSAHADL